HQLIQAIVVHPVAAAVTAGTLVAGAALTATWPTPPSPAPAVIAAPTSARATDVPPAVHEAVSPSPRVPSPTVTRRSGSPVPQLVSGRVTLESANEAGFVVTTAYSLGVL